MREPLSTNDNVELKRILILVLLGITFFVSLCVFTQTVPPQHRVWVSVSEN
jgi:hypothetical protein